jgi:hypothetical protein
MPLSKDERKLLSVGSKELRERLSYNRDIERQLAQTNMRRAKVGQRYRQRAMEKVFKLAGVDYDEILRRQEQEAKTVRGEVEQLKKKSLAHSLKVARSHKDVVARFRKSKAPVSKHTPGPNLQSVTLGYLGVPSSFDLQDMAKPADASFTTNSQGAELQFSWNTRVTDWWNPYLTLNVNYLWTPPADGSVGLLSVVAYNGFGSWAFPGSCDVLYPFLKMAVEPTLSIQQMDSVGDLHTETSPATGSVFEDHSGGCFPHAGHKFFDSVDYLQLQNDFLVEKELPVKITVTLSAYCFGHNTAGDLDFSNDGNATGRGITLPGVLFGFTAS